MYEVQWAKPIDIEGVTYYVVTPLVVIKENRKRIRLALDLDNVEKYESNVRSRDSVLIKDNCDQEWIAKSIPCELPHCYCDMLVE